MEAAEDVDAVHVDCAEVSDPCTVVLWRWRVGLPRALGLLSPAVVLGLLLSLVFLVGYLLSLAPLIDLLCMAVTFCGSCDSYRENIKVTYR